MVALRYLLPEYIFGAVSVSVAYVVEIEVVTRAGVFRAGVFQWCGAIEERHRVRETHGVLRAHENEVQFSGSRRVGSRAPRQRRDGVRTAGGLYLGLVQPVVDGRFDATDTE